MHNFFFIFIAWHHIPNGTLTRKTIESLLIIWTDCSIAVCQALAGVGGLKDIADSYNWALKYETLTPVSEYNTL